MNEKFRLLHCCNRFFQPCECLVIAAPIQIVSEPRVQRDRELSLELADPFGNLLEVSEMSVRVAGVESTVSDDRQTFPEGIGELAVEGGSGRGNVHKKGRGVRENH